MIKRDPWWNAGVVVGLAIGAAAGLVGAGLLARVGYELLELGWTILGAA